jgi:flagellar motility protein MotE (MotC chaperone)
MKPQIAAGLIEKLELPFAVEMLSRMQGDTVGSILSFVDKEKAAKICQGLVQPR